MSHQMIEGLADSIPAVLIRVPQTVARSAEAVRLQREAARTALRESAALSGAPVDGWRKSPDGAPLPQGSWHWSISHTRGWASAVVADSPVGIDVELVKPRRDELFDEIATEGEWSILGGRSWPAFFRIWTAKEAVLKANGVGIGRLDDCRVAGVSANGRMLLSYRGSSWRVEHYEFDGHIACVTCGDKPVEWRIVDALHRQSEMEIQRVGS